MPYTLSPANRRGRVLVVDDQALNLRLAHQILGAEHEVLVATTGEQGMEVCRRGRPDLILLDVQLPGISGLDVCRQLRADPDLRTIPVLFVTAATLQEEENACWEAGGADFVMRIQSVSATHRSNRCAGVS